MDSSSSISPTTRWISQTEKEFSTSWQCQFLSYIVKKIHVFTEKKKDSSSNSPSWKRCTSFPRRREFSCEKHSNSYKVAAYYSSKVIVLIPFQSIPALVDALLVYFMTDLQRSAQIFHLLIRSRLRHSHCQCHRNALRCNSSQLSSFPHFSPHFQHYRNPSHKECSSTMSAFQSTSYGSTTLTPYKYCRHKNFLV